MLNSNNFTTYVYTYTKRRRACGYPLPSSCLASQYAAPATTTPITAPCSSPKK